MLLLRTGFCFAVAALLAAGDPGDPGKHWAYQVPVAPALAGTGHPVDELLAAGHSTQGLKPGGDASRAVLLRRAWHGLTGLLPPRELQDRFLADQRPLTQWIEAVSNEALASLAFGERWARHWLDIARYADTKGYNFQAGRRYPYAFTYRDWVIRSFNEDLPYDEFVRRQIAADLMDLPIREQAALGFLTVGRRFIGKGDLIIADRIDVVYRSTMALTMQCARCHDHKSDPLTAADYYGSYGIFDSIWEPQASELPVIEEPADSPGYRTFVAELTKRAKAAHDYAEKKIKDYKRPPDPIQFDRNAAKGKLNQTERGEYERLIAKMTKLEATSEFAPSRAMVVRDHGKAREPVIFERGLPGNRGPKVPRAFPRFFREDPEAVFKQGSGRLELARELTRKSNPLTARVHANRVWMHLMGVPLVPAPGDFGVQTPQPLQQPLLDHLAVYLVDHGWSSKALIRHIMSSQAWRRSSETTEALTRADPENLYYARSNRQRKNLEAWRDTTLQVSGRLQEKVGGRPVKIHEAPFPPRRTIYGLIERQNPPSFFRVFDFPESNQPVVRRATTTTPNQALYLMNSPFLHGEAQAVAQRTRESANASEGIDALYGAIHRRPPTEIERERAARFLEQARGAGAQSAGAWSYGHGRIHRESGRVDFEPFTHYVGNAWQGGPSLPATATGWTHWGPRGGHPGHGDHATILRWHAPISGTVSITGRLERPAKAGDGVRALVVVGGRIMGEWEAGPTQALETSLPALEIEAGERIDFLVESKGDENSDSFHWAPVITRKGESLPLAEAKAGFSGPGLAPRAQLAQVLLLSNEFLFVD